MLRGIHGSSRIPPVQSSHRQHGGAFYIHGMEICTWTVDKVVSISMLTTSAKCLFNKVMATVPLIPLGSTSQETWRQLFRSCHHRQGNPHEQILNVDRLVASQGSYQYCLDSELPISPHTRHCQLMEPPFEISYLRTRRVVTCFRNHHLAHTSCSHRTANGPSPTPTAVGAAVAVALDWHRESVIVAMPQPVMHW